MEFTAIKGYGKYLGFSLIKVRGKLKFKDLLDEIKDLPKDLVIQFLDPRAIAGRNHLYHGVRLCLKAFRRRRLVSRNLQVELILYLAARRQIDESIKILGVKENAEYVLILMLGHSKDEMARHMEELISKLGEEVSTQFIGGEYIADSTYIAQIYSIDEQELDSAYLYPRPDSGIPGAMTRLEKLVVERIVLFALSL